MLISFWSLCVNLDLALNYMIVFVRPLLFYEYLRPVFRHSHAIKLNKFIITWAQFSNTPMPSVLPRTSTISCNTEAVDMSNDYMFIIITTIIILHLR